MNYEKATIPECLRILVERGIMAKEESDRIISELRESEDERIICNIKKAAELYWSDEPLNEILSWLEKQKEQKPAEWSEEDKIKLGNLLAIMEGKTGVLPGGWKLYADWLKSLRPQPHWKPSEEQMAALEASYSVLKAHDIWDEDEHLPLLLSLCDDLKKL